MDDLEKVSQAQLNSALTTTAAPLQRSLSKEDGLFLLALLNQMAKRYPNQDLTGVLPEYMKDLEQIALKYSLPEIEDAISTLRIDPEFDYFPTPNEVARQILTTRRKNLPSHIYARG